MKCFRQIVTLLSIHMAIVVSCSHDSWAQIRLTDKEQKIVDYLLTDWKRRFRSTSNPIAMSNLGIESDDEMRLRIGQHFRDNSNLANNLKYWGANNQILSNEEKLLAKYIINTYSNEERIPGQKELAEAIDIPGERLKQRLAFMVKAGLLVESTSADPGYVLADDYVTWGGPLRYNFHTVTIADGKPFDVW